MKKDKLTEVIKVRVSPKLYRNISKSAADVKRTISDFIRLVLEVEVGE